MSWVKTDDGRQDHECDRCGARPTDAAPFGIWAVVLLPAPENAKHFCATCLPVLRVALDQAMAAPGR
ncbi:MAG: hypothetical protein JNJ54_35605 [Myxococcaceae bacterium]|nr:hypothetical protein [Myxococcaceae bacterium]